MTLHNAILDFTKAQGIELKIVQKAIISCLTSINSIGIGLNCTTLLDYIVPLIMNERMIHHGYKAALSFR